MSLSGRLAMSDHALVFAAGAVLGTLYDYIHVAGQVTAYEHPNFMGTLLPFVPIQFGACALVGGFLFEALARRLPEPRITPARLALDLFLLFVAYVCTAVWVGRNDLTFVALLPVALVSIATRPSKFVLVVSAIAAVAGPAGECVMRALGIFHYVHANPVPYWLPLLWAVAAGGFMDVPLILAQRRARLAAPDAA